jgi:hypothetical protein
MGANRSNVMLSAYPAKDFRGLQGWQISNTMAQNAPSADWKKVRQRLEVNFAGGELPSAKVRFVPSRKG